MKFTFNQKILFKHCDAAGIVFYPRFFEMMNDCVEAFFDEIGSPFEKMIPAAGVPTAEITATFQTPSRHGDQLTIELELTRIGRTSIGLGFRASCDIEQRFSAQSTLVYVDVEGRPQRWPDPIRAALTPYLRSDK